MSSVYILTTIRDDGEAFTTKFEGYFAERSADAAFRECSGCENKFHIIYARLMVLHDPSSKVPFHEVRSQWPKLEIG